MGDYHLVILCMVNRRTVFRIEGQFFVISPILSDPQSWFSENEKLSVSVSGTDTDIYIYIYSN